MTKCANDGLMGGRLREARNGMQGSGRGVSFFSSGFRRAYLRRVYDAMRAVIEKRIPLVITCAGPITVSDQHRAWLIPLIRARTLRTSR